MASIKVSAAVAFSVSSEQVAEVLLRRIEGQAELLDIINSATGRERDLCLVVASVAEYLKLEDEAEIALAEKS